MTRASHEPPATAARAHRRRVACGAAAGLLTMVVVATCTATPAAAQGVITLPPEFGGVEPATSEAVRLHYEMAAGAEFGEQEAAEHLARKVTELVSLEYGEDAGELAIPLTNLAILEERNGHLTQAESDYDRSVTLLERTRGPVDRELIQPLTGLARVYLRTDRPAEAADTFERARQILRRHDGLYELAQLEMLDGQTEAYLALGDGESADRKQLLAFDLQLREYGAESPELVPAIIALAEWQTRMYLALDPPDRAAYGCLVEADLGIVEERPSRCRRPSSRALYRHAIEIMEDAYGENDPRLVGSLRGMAATYYARAGRYVPDGPAGRWGGTNAYGDAIAYEYQSQHTRARALLERALEIQVANPAVTPVEKAELYSDMGDWYVVFTHDVAAALDHYRQAWDVLENSLGPDTASATFGSPRRLSYYKSTAPPDGSRPAPVTMRLSPEEQPGYVLVEYTVTADGRAEDVQIIETSPPDSVRQERYVLRSMRTARFRPRLVDRNPVATPRQRLRHEFRYVE